jgi:hypothetical protein
LFHLWGKMSFGAHHQCIFHTHGAMALPSTILVNNQTQVSTKGIVMEYS